MKALSLWQPWATLLVCGVKKFETRGWALPNFARGVTVAIHAAQRHDPEQYDLCREEPFLSELRLLGYRDFESLPRGAIVGSVVFSNSLPVASLRGLTSLERSFGDFSPGRHAWQATQAQRWQTPVRFKGAQGFFEYYAEPETAGAGLF